MFKKLSLLALVGLTSVSAIAVDSTKVEKSMQMKDGATLYVFKDGKMGMEDKRGKVVYMKSGKLMETADGKKLVMTGNEVWRVDELLHSSHRQ